MRTALVATRRARPRAAPRHRTAKAISTRLTQTVEPKAAATLRTAPLRTMAFPHQTVHPAAQAGAPTSARTTRRRACRRWLRIIRQPPVRARRRVIRAPQTLIQAPPARCRHRIPRPQRPRQLAGVHRGPEPKRLEFLHSAGPRVSACSRRWCRVKCRCRSSCIRRASRRCRSAGRRTRCASPRSRWHPCCSTTV